MSSAKRQRTEPVNINDNESNHSTDNESQNESEINNDSDTNQEQSDIDIENEVEHSDAESTTEQLTQFQNTDRQQQMRNPKEIQDSVKKNPSFSSAIQRLLEKETTTKPILSKNTIEKRIDEKKLEAAAKKVIKNTVVKVSARQIPVASDIDRQMRKIATRGVVKLFNAIRVAQKSVDTVKMDTVQKNDKQLPEVAKRKFMGVMDEKKVEDHPVPWMKPDFGMKTKHWDEDDAEEEL